MIDFASLLWFAVYGAAFLLLALVLRQIARWSGGTSLADAFGGGYRELPWPRGVQDTVRDATIARVAEWLGPQHLHTDAAGRLSLGPGVRTDWAVFRELVRR